MKDCCKSHVYSTEPDETKETKCLLCGKRIWYKTSPTQIAQGPLDSVPKFENDTEIIVDAGYFKEVE